jgi:hypothetical protein
MRAKSSAHLGRLSWDAGLAVHRELAAVQRHLCAGSLPVCLLGWFFVLSQEELGFIFIYL